MSITKRGAWKKGLFSILAVVLLASMTTVLLPGAQPALADLPPGTFPASFHVIPPGVPNNQDQLEYNIATNSDVQQKWADLANDLGFGWCGGQFYNSNGSINEGYVGENFDVQRKLDSTGNPEYVLTSHYDGNGGGDQDNDRLVMTLSNFREVFNPSTFQFGTPIVSLSSPTIGSSVIAENPSDAADNFSNQYTWGVQGTVTNQTSLQLTEGVTVTQSVTVGFGVPGMNSNESTSVALNFQASQGWSNSYSQAITNQTTATYNAAIPADTQRTIEQTSENANSAIAYSTKAWIVYDVEFDGFLKFGGNAAWNHPTGRPDVQWKLGSDGNLGGITGNSMIGAADYVEDLWENRSIPGYNNDTSANGGIDWYWADGPDSPGPEGAVFNGNALSLYTDQEGSAVTGGFTFSGTSTQMIATDPVPLYPLAIIAATGPIPTLNKGGAYDLSQVPLAGYDTNKVPFYGFNSLPVTWATTSGNANTVSIDNTKQLLTAVAGGQDAVTATVTAPYLNSTTGSKVTSNPLGVTVAKLASISVTGAIATIKPGDSFDLSKLTVTGQDQNGNPFTITDPVTWKITSTGSYANINGDTLTATAVGNGEITANVDGVASSPINFQVENTPALTTVTLSGTLPTLYVGDSYNLSNLLSLTAQDQYSNPFSIAGQTITWSIISGSSLATISGSTLTATGKGNIAVTATVEGVASNWIGGAIDSIPLPPVLASLTLSSALPPLYVGSSYDLSKIGLKLTGQDQYGNPLDITGQPVTWSIISGNNFATISGSTLKATGVGDIAVNAVVQGVISNWIGGTIKIQPLLTTVSVSGSLPVLYPNDNCDLSQLLTVTGQDQFGKPFDISGLLPATYSASGGSATINGSTLTANSIGSGTISATVGGVTGGSVNFAVKSRPVLTTITLAGSPNLIVGNSYDLSQVLTLTGADQNSDLYSLAGLPTTWSIVSGNSFASISGSALTGLAAGPVTVEAAVYGLISQLNLTVYNPSQLNAVTATSSLPDMRVGDKCNLSQMVALAGSDQYGNSFDISGLPVSWSIVPGGNYASISGDTLTATAPGSGTITASVYGVTRVNSNPVSFTVKSASALTRLTLTGSLPDLQIGQSCNLSQLLTSYQLQVTGIDQNSAPYSFSGQPPVTWGIASGGNCVNLNGSTLTATALGNGTVNATVYGVTSNELRFTTFAIPPTGAPVINPNGGDYTTPQTVGITNIPAGDGAYYTLDGVFPTVGGAVYYNTPFTLNYLSSNPVTVTAAVYDPSTAQWSSAATAEFAILLAPAIDPNSGTFTGSQAVSITNFPANDNVYYTLDGSTPTTGSEPYTAPFTLTNSATVTAAVYDSPTRMWSPTATAPITIQVAEPTAGTATGNAVADNTTVSLSDTTSGATIYYTTDGSTPTTGSSSGTSVTITGTAGSKVTVEAYAVKADCADSPVATFSYTILSSGGGGGGGGGGTTATTPGVQTGTATSVTGTSAVLNGAITSSGSAAVTEYGFYYGSDQNSLTSKLQAGTDDHSGAFTASLGSLTTGTTYYFKAYATNADGTDYGDVLQFTATAALPPVPAPVFSDVPASYWAYDAISSLSSQGYVNGYPDGTFRPENDITRAEFVSIMDKVLKLAAYNPQMPTFTDVQPGDWFDQSVGSAVYDGIAKGYGDGTFRPGNNITREELACVLVQAMGETDEAMASMSAKTNFTDDASISSWARGFVVVAVKDGLLKGYPDGSFGPRGNATRAEACAMIANFLNINK